MKHGDREQRHASALFTIGHSTRTIDDFVELLRVGGVRQVIDIRAIPRSRTNPQFNEDSLGEALAGREIGEAVFHLMDKKRAEPARLSEGAVSADGVLTYPAAGGRGLIERRIVRTPPQSSPIASQPAAR